MILLNEFLPEDLGRRSFAAGGEVDKEQLKAGQLSKAAEMLAKTNESCVKFPYHDV
jgi:hypothetical protein